MSASPTLRRAALIARATAAILLLLALPAAYWFTRIHEPSWAPPPQVAVSPERAFFHGTIGTELMPLPVAVALPELFPELFRARPGLSDDWLDQFGFIRPDDHPGATPPRDEQLKGLPLGWTVSNYRQKTGSPSPVKFVGFTCAMCHTTEIRRTRAESGALVVGPGNYALNFFAYLDAFQVAVLDERRLTVPEIARVFQARRGRELTFEEAAMIRLWLAGIRNALHDTTMKFDDGPYGGPASFEPEHVPTGPARTQPFRTLVRSILGRPGSSMGVYTKIAPLYQQSLQGWFQVDGSIRDLRSRSAAAALAAGATVDNLKVPEIADNVLRSTEFTHDLAGPKYVEVFPDLASAIDRAKADRGRVVYMKHCATCHGHPDTNTGAWVKGTRHDEVVLLAEIGTDARRVTYQFRAELAEQLYRYIPEGHPFQAPRDEIRPGPSGTAAGYSNKPIPHSFTRTPFLHNGSVLTLAELINLIPRRTVFWRGHNLYDPRNLGLISPPADPERPTATGDPWLYFLFDTRTPGNSNAGHDYPWKFQERAGGWNEAELGDLLEFLKTI